MKAKDKYLTVQQIQNLERELERTGVFVETVLERYHIHSLEQMTKEIYEKAISSLKKTKAKEAA